MGGIVNASVLVKTIFWKPSMRYFHADAGGSGDDAGGRLPSVWEDGVLLAIARSFEDFS